MSVHHYLAELVAAEPPKLRYRFTANFLAEPPSYGLFEVCTDSWKHEILETEKVNDSTSVCVAGLVSKLRRHIRDTGRVPDSLKLIS